MEIDFKPEDVESYVKAALIKSSIGKAIDKGIAEVLSGSYNNPIRKHLELVVSDVAGEVIREKYQERIKHLVVAYIEKAVNEDMLNNLTNVAVKKMTEAMNNRD